MLGWWLDLLILKISSNFDDSVILWLLSETTWKYVTLSYFGMSRNSKWFRHTSGPSQHHPKKNCTCWKWPPAQSFIMEKLTNNIHYKLFIMLWEIVQNSQISGKIILPKSRANLLQLRTKISTSLLIFQIFYTNILCSNFYGSRGYMICGTLGHPTKHRSQDYNSEIDFASWGQDCKKNAHISSYA